MNPITVEDCFQRQNELKVYVDTKVNEIYTYIDDEIGEQRIDFKFRIEKMEAKIDAFQWWLLGALFAMIGTILAGMYVIVQIVATP